MSARELTNLKKRLLFQERLDEFLESAGQRRLPLSEALDETVPLLLKTLGGTKAWVDTLDEQLEERVFGYSRNGSTEIDPALVSRARALVDDDQPRGAHASHEGQVLHARRLDVAGVSFGTIAALGPAGDEAEIAERDALLHVAAEELDNYLAAVRHAREKQRLLRSIHKALRHPIVPRGVADAVSLINQSVPFDLLIVLYHMEEDYQNTLHYLVFRGTELEFSSRERVASELDRVLHDGDHPPDASLLISNAEVEHRRVVGESIDVAREERSEELMARLGYQESLETMLISGVQEEATVGKLVVGSRRPLSTYERDVFDLFADVLQKRIVDFSRAGKILHRTFPIPTVMRLLDQEDPMQLLAPHAEEISILYADVVSFTRLSEQVLRDPARVGDLIETWAREAVRILWQHGGVFDKLVGDCVIGLFGPPFYEAEPLERALCCARAAAEIVRWTRDVLPTLPVAAPIVEAGESLGVAIGINDCPASVGVFGPNKNFTAFAPGMNNTARLQSIASRDEVLVLEPMRPLLEQAAPGVRFGERREGRVKNVADPLVYYALELSSLPTT